MGGGAIHHFPESYLFGSVKDSFKMKCPTIQQLRLCEKLEGAWEIRAA